MKPILLVDFGSTNTKVTAVDVEACEILGTAAAYTTVETDINEGLEMQSRFWNRPRDTLNLKKNMPAQAQPAD